MKSAPRRTDPSCMGQTTASTGGLRLSSRDIDLGAQRRATAPAAIDAPMRIERRAGDRSRARGQGIGTFVDPDGRLWLTRVTLVDRSGSGLGVRCPVPVAQGATFSLSVEGSMTPLQGVVAHARGRGGAYRLGLRCACRLAA